MKMRTPCSDADASYVEYFGAEFQQLLLFPHQLFQYFSSLLFSVNEILGQWICCIDEFRSVPVFYNSSQNLICSCNDESQIGAFVRVINTWRPFFFFKARSQTAKSEYYLRHVCPSVCLSVLPFRMEQLGCHWTHFHENWYLSISRKSAEKNLSLQGGTNTCVGQGVKESG